MTQNPVPQRPTAHKRLNLSPEVLAALELPLTVGPRGWHDGTDILNASGNRIAIVIGWDTSDAQDTELAAFIADLLNAALLNAALTPSITIEPETTAELHQANDLDLEGVSIRERLDRR